jgi:hypothetical protein
MQTFLQAGLTFAQVVALSGGRFSARAGSRGDRPADLAPA